MFSRNFHPTLSVFPVMSKVFIMKNPPGSEGLLSQPVKIFSTLKHGNVNVCHVLCEVAMIRPRALLVDVKILLQLVQFIKSNIWFYVFFTILFSNCSHILA